jgi:hypothetical protein
VCSNAACNTGTDLLIIWAQVVSGPKGVVMSAQSFVMQFCQRLDKHRPRSLARVGYEALRWAMLSTDVRIASMAHSMYRILLTYVARRADASAAHQCAAHAQSAQRGLGPRAAAQRARRATRLGAAGRRRFPTRIARD